MTDDAEEVKSRTDIVSIISERVQLKKAGRNFKGLCPFHSEKTPSFVVSPELQIYKCFGCGESGDVFTFLEKDDGMDFKEALKYLADRAGIKLHSFSGDEASEKDKLMEINSLAARFYHYVLTNHEVGKVALDYLSKERGLKIETLKEFSIGFSPNSPTALEKFLVDKKKFHPKDLEKVGLVVFSRGGFFDRFRGRVVFPLADHRGNVVGFSGRILPSDKRDLAKYINSPETPLYHKSNLLYGLDKSRDFIKKKRTVIVVEGEMDFIACWEAGIKNVVGLKGTAFTEDQVRLLKRFCEKMILCLDSDIAGDTAAIKGIAEAFSQGFEIKVAKLPLGVKDPDEAARKFPQEFKEALIKALGVWDYIINSKFAKFDATTGAGKAKISKEIVPILKSITDEIVAAHYINLVANKLGVPPESVSSEVQKDSTPAFQTKTEPFEQLEEKSKNRRQLLEENILALSFQSSIEGLEDPSVKDLIVTPLAKRILEEYLVFSETHKEFNPSEFSEILPKELFKGFAEMLLKAKGEDPHPEELTKEIKENIKELEILDIRHKLEIISAKIRRLEDAKNSSETHDAQVEFGELAKKLSELEDRERRSVIFRN